MTWQLAFGQGRRRREEEEGEERERGGTCDM